MLNVRARIGRQLRRGWRRRRSPGDESGFVLAFVAISLVVLLAMAGFAVDYWHWSREGTRLQKAADAAALAGAVYMPDNVGQAGYTAAQQVAGRNGYTNGQNNVTVNPTTGELPTQLKVTIHEQVKNFFGSLVGAGTTTVTKHAVAEYEPSVSMGSPINQFGNDPESGAALGTARYPELWANVFGPSSNKDKGDAYQAGLCAGGDSTTAPVTSNNTDYDPNGYFYGVTVKPGATGPLTFQIYDPEFANVGDNCGDNSTANGAPGTNLIGVSQLPPNFNPQFAVSDPATRYSPSSNSVFCNGDQYYSDGNNNLTPPWTDYIIRAPDDTPSNPANNPVQCSVDFPGYLGDLKAALQATTSQAGAPDLFVKYFRQWYTVCTVPNPVPGTYFIQVKSNTKADGSAAPVGGGANRFAMRVGLNGDFQTANAAIAGLGPPGHLRQLPRSEHDLLPRPGAGGRAGPDADRQLLRRR